MKQTWLLVVALVGCTPNTLFHCASSEQCRSGATPGTCEASGYCSFPDAECSSGQRYDATAGELGDACVEGLSLGTDRDGDGVVDGLDNCPTIANADQGNEDGDMYGDACDPCPPVADDLFVDSDGDGIDDQCDPHIGQIDHLVLFEGFHHGIPADWHDAGWVASGDSVAFDGEGFGSGSADTTAILSVPYTGMTSVTASAGIAPTVLPTLGTAGVITTVKDKDALLCALSYQSSGTGSQSAMVMVDTKSSTMASKPWAINTSSSYTLAQTWNLGLAASCTISGGATSVIAPITLTTANGEAKEVGVYAKSFAVQIQWVMLTSL